MSAFCRSFPPSPFLDFYCCKGLLMDRMGMRRWGGLLEGGPRGHWCLELSSGLKRKAGGGFPSA